MEEIDGKEYAECNYCKTIISYHKSTTTLIEHVGKQHAHKNLERKTNMESGLGTSMEQSQLPFRSKETVTATKTKHFDEAIVKFIVGI